MALFRVSFVYVLLSLVQSIQPLRMLLHPQQVRCIKHESPAHANTNGHFEAAGPITHSIDLMIKNTKGHKLFNRENITKGTFAFTTQEFDVFDACFYSHLIPGHRRPIPREIFFDVKQGAETKNVELLAKAEKLKPMEAEVRRLEALSDEIVRDFNTLHAKSSKMRGTNESTHNRVLYLSLLSMLILLAFACWQVLYLRRYFKSKKLIE